MTERYRICVDYVPLNWDVTKEEVVELVKCYMERYPNEDILVIKNKEKL